MRQIEQEPIREPTKLESIGRLYTVRQVAKILSLQPSTVYNWIWSKKINTISVGMGEKCQKRITERELERFIHIATPDTVPTVITPNAFIIPPPIK